MDETKYRTDKETLSNAFFEVAARLVAEPAAEKSLHSDAIGPIVRDALSKNNTVYFGEWHDDVNNKFFADNPDIFKEAKAQNATKLFLEIDSSYAPLYKAYFNDDISDKKFKRELLTHNRQGAFSSGDSPEAMTEQMYAMAKTAKAEGVTILPSDFRDLDHNRSVNLPIDYTSAAYGIPDVQRFDDEVDRQTKLSLKEYKDMYAGKTGSDIPMTVSQQKDFKYLHSFRIDSLTPEEKKKFDDDLNKRADEFKKDKATYNIGYQNELQFRYYSMLVEPGEKALFYGGRNHIARENNTAQILENNGYGTTAAIDLLSDGGSMHSESMKVMGDLTPNADLPRPFDYLVQTQTGQITKYGESKGEPKIEPPQNKETQLAVQPKQVQQQPSLSPQP